VAFRTVVPDPPSFLNLAQSAERRLTILAPFIDDALECGVIVHGRSAHELYGVVEALIAVASRIEASAS
jgi:hypothetical protein